MAKAKAKKAKGKGKSSFTFAKVPVSHYRKTLADLKKGKAPETSGELIRARLVEGGHTAADIVTEVHKRFKDSSSKPSDVYWNRGRLKKEGVKVPDMPKNNGNGPISKKAKASKKASKK